MSKWRYPFSNLDNGEEVPVKNTFAFLAGAAAALVGVMVGLTAKSATEVAEKAAKNASK